MPADSGDRYIQILQCIAILIKTFQKYCVYCSTHKTIIIRIIHIKTRQFGRGVYRVGLGGAEPPKLKN